MNVRGTALLADRKILIDVRRGWHAEDDGASAGMGERSLRE